MKPPGFIERLITWGLDSRTAEAYLGDLEEKFLTRLKNGMPLWKSKMAYLFESFGFIKMIDRSLLLPHYKNQPIMLLNFITTGFRFARREKFYSLLNIVGLITGTVSIMVIFAFVFNEFSYDQFHADAKKIYRLTTVSKAAQGEMSYALNEGIWDAFLGEANGIDYSTAFTGVQSDLVFSIGENSFVSNRGYYADKDFFSVFDFDLRAGNRNSLLSEPNSIVITESLARKWFNSTDVLGKTVLWKDGQAELNITGVVEDIPLNSHLSFDFLISVPTNSQLASFLSSSSPRGMQVFYIYFKTSNFLTSSDVQERVDRAFQSVRIADAEKQGSDMTPVQPLDEIYFNAKNEFEPTAGGNVYYVKMFAAIGVSLLVITIINFVNISSSRSLRRVKEVGIRKALGTSRLSLANQFLTESILVTLLTSLISYGLSLLVIRQLSLSFYPIELSIMTSPEAIAVVIAYGFVLGILAGFYPSYRITMVLTTEALKGKMILGRESFVSARNILVLFQLSISICLIAFLFLISRQMEFLNARSLGFGKESMIYFKQPNTSTTGQWSAFYDRLQNHSSIKSSGGSLWPLVETDHGRMNATWIWTKKDRTNSIPVAWNYAGFDLLETMDIPIQEGRSFSKKFPSDTTAIIINDAAKKALGLEEAVGITLSWWRGNFEVIGVMEDFHFKPFGDKISPVILILDPGTSRILTVRSNNIQETVNVSKAAWNDLKIDAPFSVHYFDDAIRRMMKKEEQLGAIITGFTSVALIIMAIGLAGLVGYITSRRQKEIVIRKVYGASVLRIIGILNFRYAFLLLTAVVVSFGVFFYAATSWLSTFEYKVLWSVWDFVLAIGTVVAISLVVVESYAIKSALQNPIVALREE